MPPSLRPFRSPTRTRPGTLGALAFALLFGGGACTPRSDEAPPEASDAKSQAKASVEGAPSAAGAATEAKRIVSLGGAVTETLFALGLGERVVAIDTSSLYPPEATARPTVGYVRAASAEGILSMDPDHIVASEDLGPPSLPDQLRGAGIPLTLVSGTRSVAGAIARVETLARAFGRAPQGHAVIARMKGDLARVAERVAATSEEPKVLFVYARGSASLMVAGRETGPDAIIRLAGGVNAADLEGFKALTREAALQASPEIVLMTTLGAESLGGGATALTAIGLPPGAIDPAPRLITLEDGLLLGFGPRTGEAALALFEALHPVAAGAL